MWFRASIPCLFLFLYSFFIIKEKFCVEVVNEFYKEEISRSRYQTIDEMCVDDFRPERKTIEEFETVVAHQEEPVMEEDELER